MFRLFCFFLLLEGVRLATGRFELRPAQVAHEAVPASHKADHHLVAPLSPLREEPPSSIMRRRVESSHPPDTSTSPSRPQKKKATKDERRSLLRTVKKDFRTCCCLSVLFGGAIFSTAALLLRVPALPVDPAAITAAGNRYVTLKDGRMLEYVVCGAPEPTSESVEAPMAVYAAHGYAGTGGMVAAPWMCEAYLSNNMRVFAVTMPGFGLSDSMPLGRLRSLAEWGADVLAVLEREGVIEENLSEETSSSEETPRHQSSYRKKIGILGLSTGCVHATAVARALPPDRIQAILLSSPTAPISAEFSHSGRILGSSSPLIAHHFAHYISAHNITANSPAESGLAGVPLLLPAARIFLLFFIRPFGQKAH